MGEQQIGKRKFPQGNPPSQMPNVTGEMPKGAKAASPQTLSLFCFVFIVTRCGSYYWAWLTSVNRLFALGYKWKNGEWVRFIVFVRKIKWIFFL